MFFRMAAEVRRELPISFAEGLRHFDEVLLPDQEWFQVHEGQHVAILNNEVVDKDNDPHQLANRVKEAYPDTVLYMPHVVKLPEPIRHDEWGAQLPRYWLDAERYYEEVLRRDPKWLINHIGKYVSIIGRQVVGEGSNLENVSREFEQIYRYVPIFRPYVTRKYPYTAKIRRQSELVAI